MKIKKLIILVLLVASMSVSAKEVPSSGEMMVDVLLVRPFGVVSLVFGVVLFVPATVFSLPSSERATSIKQSGNRLVIYPFRFTFMRKIGEFPGYMEELEYVSE